MILNLPELLKNQPKRKLNPNFKPSKTSLRTELWYRNALLELVRKFRQAVESEDFFANEVNLNDSKFTDADKDFDADRFLKAAEKLSKADIDGVAKKIVQGLLMRGNAQNIQEVKKDLKRQTGVDLQGYLNNSGKVAEKLEQLTTANVQLIKSIHSQYLDKIQASVMQAQVKGTPTKELAKQIQEIGGVTEKRAKLIARDQSAKINASLTKARHEEMGVTQYIWSTSGDERVRDSHAENDGKVFSYDNPPLTGNPGDEVNCRCIAVPVLVESQLPTNKSSIQSLEEEISEIKPIETIRPPKVDTTEFKKSASKTKQKLDNEKSNFEFILNEVIAHSGLSGWSDVEDIYNKEFNFINKIKMQKSEFLSIVGYTVDYYKNLNHSLRIGKLEKNTKQYAEILNNALDKLPSHKGIVYRSIRGGLSERDLERYQVGEVVKEEMFTSTSTLTSEQLPFFDGGVKFEIKSKNGKKIDHLSMVDFEKEVLFKSGSTFRVKSKTENRGVITIKMEEI